MGEVQAPYLFRAASLIDLEYRYGFRASAQVPPGGVGRAPRSADGKNLGPGRTNHAHERCPAHSQGGKQLRRG
jgi:hypothetical protein